MDRYRWLNLKTPCDFKNLPSLLNHLSFEENGVCGFSIVRIRQNAIDAKFIERKIIEDEFIDTSGLKQTLERVVLDEFPIQFINFNNFANLLITNYPRSLLLFKNKLSEMLDFNASIIDIKSDPLKWIENIESNDNLKLSVTSIQIKDVLYKNGLVGKIILKGETDIRDRMLSEITSEFYKIDKVHAKISGEINGEILLSSDGSSKISVDNLEKCSDILANFLNIKP